MIPKAEVLSVANDSGLLPTTVEKDYVLGWVLFGIASHSGLGLWIFKGGRVDSTVWYGEIKIL